MKRGVKFVRVKIIFLYVIDIIFLVLTKKPLRLNIDDAARVQTYISKLYGGILFDIFHLVSHVEPTPSIYVGTNRLFYNLLLYFYSFS